MQMNIPRFQLAHRGCLLRLQSAQLLFDSSLTNCFSVAVFWAALPEDVWRDMRMLYVGDLLTLVLSRKVHQ
jgi:hypothetical protein